MAELPDPVTIGTVVGTHGVRGTLRVRPMGTGEHLREGVAPLVAGARRAIKDVRVTPKGFLLDLRGVDDRRVAAALKGEGLFLDRAELDGPEEGEFYVGDLVGLTAMSEAGERLGEVAETFETAAHEVLVVRTDADDILVPFTMEHVPEVDLGSGSITVRPPE
ncbi:MAG: ribosome maturation factor RimM [Actinomycetota bacterium]|nr:ribosome maturation factor RimM [Actinomycetota bacterium]